MIGVVKFFNNVKGWGLIEAEADVEQEYDKETFFIHHSDIKDARFFPIGKPLKYRTLTEGQRVSFKIFISKKQYMSAKELVIKEDSDV